MRVGLNLLHVRPEIGGGWTYIANLVAAVTARDLENSYIAFVTGRSRPIIPTGLPIRVITVPLCGKSQMVRVLFENTILQAMALRERLDVMHWFANVKAVANAVPAVVTVYDLHVLANAAAFPRLQRTYLRWRIPATARTASRLLPMSHATADDLVRVCGARPERMTVIRPIIEDTFSPPPPDSVEGVRRKYGLPRSFWLYVAHLYPHKNHLRLLEAYAELRSRGLASWPLLLRGDMKPGGEAVLRRIATMGLQDEIRMLPRLERHEMPALYGAASACVYPSFFEGGAIPIVEAMATGCQIAAANLPAIQEAAGDAALYFNPHDPVDIAATMEEIQADGDTNRVRSILGCERAKAYRAPEVVGELVKAYRSVAE